MLLEIPPWAEQSVADLFADLAEGERAEDRLVRASLLDGLTAQVEKAIRRREFTRRRTERWRQRRQGADVPLRRPGRPKKVTAA